MKTGTTAPWVIVRKRAVTAALFVSVCAAACVSTASKTGDSSPVADSITAKTMAESPSTTKTASGKPAASDSGARKQTSRVVTSTRRPHLTRLTPATGSAGQVTVVEVTGSGFTDTGNVLHFGSIPLDGIVSSAGGTTLKFTVPQTLPSRSEAPPMAMAGGEYAVYVVNANGTSDTLKFTLKDR